MDTEIEGTSAALYNFLFHGIPFQQSQEIRGTSPATEHTDIRATSSSAEHIHSKSSSSDAESMEIIPSRAHAFLLPPMDPLLLPPMNPWLLPMDPLMEGISATEITGSLSLRRMDPLMDETSATEITGSLSPRMDPLMDETSATESTGSLSPRTDPLMDETSATESTGSLSPRTDPLMDETSATESSGSLSPRMDPLMHETSVPEITAHAVITQSRERTHWLTNSIVRVPEHIRSKRKSNFEPKLVSIGPYYHGGENLKGMQGLKTRCKEEIQKMLGISLRRTNHPREYDEFVVSARKAREYYRDQGFDHEDDKFVEMLFLDSCFIIRTILAFSKQIQSISFLDVHIKDVRSDLLLLDNQIPLFFIQEVYEWFLKNLKHKKLAHFHTVLEPFICLDMPWRINHDATSREAAHLLHLYQRYSLPPQMDMQLTSSERDHSNSSEIDLSNNIPMVIANATELQQTAGIKFEKFKEKRHLDVIFSNGIMRMPPLKIDSKQITLLRNLIAFEASIPAKKRIISCYMKLMDALIDSDNDVKLLQKSGVIYNTLSSHERAATFFNEIGDFCFTDDNTNPFSGLHKDVQEYYNSRWHRRLASLRHNYFSSPWTSISVVAAVILLLLSVFQAFYNIYGYYHPKN